MCEYFILKQKTQQLSAQLQNALCALSESSEIFPVPLGQRCQEHSCCGGYYEVVQKVEKHFKLGTLECVNLN